MRDHSDDLLAPAVSETHASPADVEAEPRDDQDDSPGLSAEESLAQLPPD